MGLLRLNYIYSIAEASIQPLVVICRPGPIVRGSPKNYLFGLKVVL